MKKNLRKKSWWKENRDIILFLLVFVVIPTLILSNLFDELTKGDVRLSNQWQCVKEENKSVLVERLPCFPVYWIKCLSDDCTKNETTGQIGFYKCNETIEVEYSCLIEGLGCWNYSDEYDCHYKEGETECIPTGKIQEIRCSRYRHAETKEGCEMQTVIENCTEFGDRIGDRCWMVYYWEDDVWKASQWAIGASWGVNISNVTITPPVENYEYMEEIECPRECLQSVESRTKQKLVCGDETYDLEGL